MRVDRDVILGGLRNDLLEVSHHFLAVVPGEMNRAIWSFHLRAAGISDVARLHTVDAVLLIKREAVVHLFLVMRRVSAGLVMPDEMNAFLEAILAKRLEIEV